MKKNTKKNLHKKTINYSSDLTNEANLEKYIKENAKNLIRTVSPIDEMSSKDFLLTLIKKEVSPAYGCTEIGIVSLVAAKAATMLKGNPTHASITLSPYVYKNDTRVGVPKLGRCGIKTIVAAGLILKNPEKKLNIVSELKDEQIAKAEALGKDPTFIELHVDFSVPPVYAKIVVTDNYNDTAEVIIMYSHDNIVSAKLNGKETIKFDPSQILPKDFIEKYDFDSKVDEISLRHAHDICKTLKYDEISWLKEGIDMNNKIAEEGLKKPKIGSITYELVRTFNKKTPFFSDSGEKWVNDVTLYTCAAVDARMNGSTLPVMTSSNSGDHGITVTVPQYQFAKNFKIPELKLLQATAFAHFVTWKIKSKIGHLCGMCGSAVAAGAAAVAGVAFQKGLTWNAINDCLNMHILSQAGIICDGAKPSCSFKILTSLNSGLVALEFASRDCKIEHKDGIIHKNADETINNLGHYSNGTKDAVINSVIYILRRTSESR